MCVNGKFVYCVFLKLCGGCVGVFITSLLDILGMTA